MYTKILASVYGVNAASLVGMCYYDTFQLANNVKKVKMDP